MWGTEDLYTPFDPGDPDDNMYNDSSTIPDLGEVYVPPGGGTPPGGGGGGTPPTTPVPPTTPPVPYDYGTPIVAPTPVGRPVSTSGYVPQQVAASQPWRLKPTQRGVGSLADVLNTQKSKPVV
jgi:hypothetical protein